MSVPTRLQRAHGSVPALVVGAPLGDYQLYYLFPLDQEQQTLLLLQRTLAGVGLALVLLLAAIASLVTRWVVIPLREAAQASERLTGGHLEERMPVHGTDDLARLGTSFNQMARSLQDKIAELQELSKVQRQFVSDVSHELRTPLTTIRIAADVLFEAKDELGEAEARSAELLQSQLERFESLLVDLLEISRYDANAATLETEQVDIRDLVLRAVADAQQIAERRGSGVELRLPGDPCIADVDGRRVERILRNLIVNAVEHGEGKDILVERGHRQLRGRHRRAGLRGGPAARRGDDGVRPLLARRSSTRAYQRWDRARAVDRARGYPPAWWLAAGLGRSRQRLGVPAHLAPLRRRRASGISAPACSRQVRLAQCSALT